MNLSDRAAARLRTVWPMAIGGLAAWLLAHGTPVTGWIDTTLGWEVTEAQVAAVLGIVLGAGVHALGQWLEVRPGSSRYAILARLAGRWLLSVGLYTGQPRYSPPSVQGRTAATGQAINISFPPASSSTEVGRQVVEVIRAYEQRRGW